MLLEENIISFARLKQCLATCLFALLAITTPATASDETIVDLAKLQTLGNVQFHHIDAKQLGRGFDIFVKTPAASENPGQKYPTLYLLDGGISFPLFAAYNDLLRFANEAPDMVIVGISYGTNNPREGNFRDTDFTVPTTSRAHYGGASKFQAFLRDELIPFIEANYASDPDKRIIFGQSLGAQFVLYSAQTEPDLFWGRIASNPAIYRNLPFFLPEQMPVATKPGKLFVSSGTAQASQYHGPATKWMAHWDARKRLPWALKTVVLEGETHVSAPPRIYRLAMQWLFAADDD